jgi:hypothetical protein
MRSGPGVGRVMRRSLCDESFPGAMLSIAESRTARLFRISTGK